MLIIATASDENFVPGLLALVQSAHHHNPVARFLIMDVGISNASHEMLTTMLERYRICANVVRIDQDVFARFPDVDRFTRAAYARFLIPELLADQEKALYLDADALVTSDLSELWATDLTGCFVAAAKDEFILASEAAQAGITPDKYFNSGVLLMNLALWRSEHVARNAMAVIEREPGLSLPDQTALNAVSRGRVVFLDRKWNFFASGVAELPVTEPSIVHFTGAVKPWLRRDTPLFGYYWRHARTTGLEIAPAPNSKTVRQIRKTVLGLLGLRPKYWRPLLVEWRYWVLLQRYIARLDSVPDRVAGGG